MSTWLALVLIGMVVMVGSATVLSTTPLLLWGLLGGFIVLSAGILYRPRELHARERNAALGSPGAGWGHGVGPVPGQTGAVIPASGLPLTLTRQYTGFSRSFILEVAAADAELLAARGYRQVSSQYIEGHWRSADWLAAVLLLLFFFIFGLVALVHLASNKPTGTQVVAFERRSAADATVPPAPPAFGSPAWGGA